MLALDGVREPAPMMPKRDITFYKRSLAKRLALLEQYQNRDMNVRAACLIIRAALDTPTSLAVIKMLSQASGLMLRGIKLPPESKF